jgi:hypothetical protein
MSILYLPYEKIDFQKWDACIGGASNGSVYALSTYLDHMSPGWDALIQDDYEAVMPLTHKKKWGIEYLYQPPLTAEGGIFGKASITTPLLNAFLQAIPTKYKLWEFSLNRGNLIEGSDFPIYKRMNFILPLNKPYEEISEKYRKDLKANLKKAAEEELEYHKATGIDAVIGLADRKLKSLTNLTNKDYENFKALTQKLNAKIRAVRNKNGAILASGVFFFSHDKAYYVLAGNHDEGRKTGASHFLLDQFIKEFANTKITFDFEGSDLPNLAMFYKGFGAEEAPYAAIRLNRLPKAIRWLKG